MHQSGGCALCDGVCSERVVTISLPRSMHGIAMIRNVPAWVCDKCGEPHFSVETTGQVMAMVREGNPPDDFAKVPIYDMARAR